MRLDGSANEETEDATSTERDEWVRANLVSGGFGFNFFNSLCLTGSVRTARAREELNAVTVDDLRRGPARRDRGTLRI